MHSIVARLFTLALLLVSSALVADELNTDRPGLDYYSFNLSSPNPALCRQSCDADARCKAWTYVRPGVQGPTARCWLKHAVPRAYGNNCCISGVKGSSTSDMAPLTTPVPKADCGALRQHFEKRCNDMRGFYSKMNCDRHGYSGCALDVAGCFTPFLPGHVFTDEACAKPGYKSCASHAYSGYVNCLSGCNKAAIEGRLPEGRTPCAQRCQGQIEAAVRGCGN